MTNDYPFWTNFLENNKLKKKIEREDILRFYDLCLRKKGYANTPFPEEFYKFIVSNKYFDIFQKVKNFTKKDIKVIAFIQK